MTDADYMGRALALARRARGQTSPNPMVGCIIVRDGEILSTGFHVAAGRPHAEADALAKLGFSAPGATLYVNLEPCCHHGRTPPCTDAILRSGVRRVVAGMVDPNPVVAGKGLQILRDAGVEVQLGVQEAACRALNEGFSHYIMTGRPFVTLKGALTLDGRIATRTGASRWITSEAARRAAHRMRGESDAILVGVGTVLADDPQLTVRAGGRRGARPLRAVVDSGLRTPPSSKIADTSAAPTVLYCAEGAAPDRAGALRARGVEICPVPVVEGRLSLEAVLADLGQRRVVYLMVEGGAEVAGGLVDAGLVDRYALFIAPKVFGGVGAPSFIGGRGVEEPSGAPSLRFRQVRRVGPDLFVEAVPAATD